MKLTRLAQKGESDISGVIMEGVGLGVKFFQSAMFLIVKCYF